MGAAAEVLGAPAVAETFSGRAPRRAARARRRDRRCVWAVGGEPRVVFRFRFTQAQVSAIEMLSDPATLGELDLEMLPA